MSNASVFTDLCFDDALEQNRTNNKLLIVDAFAEWCGPCKEMDRSTWASPKVNQWVQQNGLAIKVNVDENQPFCTQYQVEAMPTVLVFKAGECIDRHIGYMSARELLTFLTNVSLGRPSLEALYQSAFELSIELLNTRFDIANRLIENEDFQAATREMTWLWQNTKVVSQDYFAQRLSEFVTMASGLVSQYPGAEKAFQSIRNEYESFMLKGEYEESHIDEWVAINEIATSDAMLVERFLAIQCIAGTGRHFQSRVPILLRELFAQKLFKEAGLVVKDMPKYLTRLLQELSAIPANSTNQAVDKNQASEKNGEGAVTASETNRIFDTIAAMFVGAMAASKRSAVQDMIDLVEDSRHRNEIRQRISALAKEAGLLQHEPWLW